MMNYCSEMKHTVFCHWKYALYHKVYEAVTMSMRPCEQATTLWVAFFEIRHGCNCTHTLVHKVMYFITFKFFWNCHKTSWLCQWSVTFSEYIPAKNGMFSLKSKQTTKLYYSVSSLHGGCIAHPYNHLKSETLNSDVPWVCEHPYCQRGRNKTLRSIHRWCIYIHDFIVTSFFVSIGYVM